MPTLQACCSITISALRTSARRAVRQRFSTTAFMRRPGKHNSMCSRVSPMAARIGARALRWPIRSSGVGKRQYKLRCGAVTDIRKNEEPATACLSRHFCLERRAKWRSTISGLGLYLYLLSIPYSAAARCFFALGTVAGCCTGSSMSPGNTCGPRPLQRSRYR